MPYVALAVGQPPSAVIFSDSRGRLSHSENTNQWIASMPVVIQSRLWRAFPQVTRQEGEFRIVDVRTGAVRRVWPHDGEAVSLSLSPDGSTLAARDREGVVRVWDVPGASSKRGIRPVLIRETDGALP